MTPVAAPRTVSDLPGGHAAEAPPALDPARFAPAARLPLGAPGLRAFQAIAELWGLDELSRRLVLGLPARSTYFAWAKAACAGRAVLLPVDTLLRISAVLGIHKALAILHDTEAKQVAWMRTPHTAPPFFGQAPIALVTSGTQDGLMAVRRFLDAARGGIFMSPNEADRGHALRDDDIILG